MAWSAPPAWGVGNVVTEAKLDIISDDLNFLHDSYLAWTTYTPTLTQSTTVTKSVTYAKYIQFGKTVICHGYMICSGAGTAANAIVVGLPVTAAHGTASRAMGSAIVYDASITTYYPGIPIPATTTTMSFVPSTVPATNFLGAAEFTVALASSDQISWSITYEAA